MWLPRTTRPDSGAVDSSAGDSWKPRGHTTCQPRHITRPPITIRPRSIRPRSIRPPITIRPRTIRPRFWILPSYPPATRPPAPATAVAATRSSPPRPRFECTHPSKRRLPPLRLHEPIRVPGHRQSRAGRSDSPPNPPAPARVQPKPASPNTSPTSPAPSGGVERPRAPAGPEDLEPAPAGDQTTGSGSGGRRVVQKPVLPASREVRSQFRNVLFGRVKTRDTNEPEEGVRVTISNRTNAYADRVALTDAFGRFAVKVPDGDWTVNVTMPSGRAYSVSQITVSNGLISDDIGRDIPSLVITR